LTKAFSERFGFDLLELRNFQTDCQKQSNEDAPFGDYILRYIFIWRGVFSVARFDNQGNAKASTGGTGIRTGSTSFFELFG
jgi:hypothetical protein